ncbi:MAG: peptidoglycan-binding protein [Acidobacteriaceae bacterium]|nr:peptidoglycan-binding protein [Acidobacteriaceae bacterium]MBV9780061.1 peptidoglycan-binding protein [Acidobacteriaceae bacterium]
MKWLLTLTVFGAIAIPAFTQTSHKPQTNRHSTKRRRSGRASTPSYQSHPDAERYQEIQKALAERGYFKGEVNGQWGEDSVDALKRFQADQKIPNDGKIDSLSLIGLGLGPKHSEGAGGPSTSGTAPNTATTPPTPDQADRSSPASPPH